MISAGYLASRINDSGKTALRKCGHEWRGCCPIHGGDNPTAFVVFEGDDKPLYYCFVCGAWGDMNDWLKFIGEPATFVPDPEAARARRQQQHRERFLAQWRARHVEAMPEEEMFL